MINLPPTDILKLQSLKKTAVLILLFARVDPQPVTAKDVSVLLDIDEHTAAKYLGKLSLHGYITRCGYHDGYILTAGGKQITLNSALLPAPAEIESGQMRNFHISETLVVEESIKESSLIDSSREQMREFHICPPEPETSFSLNDVLKLAPMLFDGERVSAAKLDRVDAMVALKWLVYAYERRDKLRAPCGLIYSRLKEQADPPDDVNVMTLPARALRALGIVSQAVNNEQDDDLLAAEVDDAAPVCAADETVTDDVKAWWSQIREAVRAELSRAQFETWVGDLVPLSWRDDVLTLGARNAFQVEWLGTHLANITLPGAPGATMHFVIRGADVEEMPA
jgi:DNA-binding IscR family transcriptional regulator